MLALRPACENCDKPLPPNSLDAWICSYECTFCGTCVSEVLENVCPNCGGAFCQRPIRPAQAWKGETCLDKYPASTAVKHRPVDPVVHAELVARAGKYPPQDR